ncbi:hypothetical protein GRI68_13300 [Altererythrobacter halimionae]|uniref:Uncharacterized protein n=2 Tax=Alteriqipengyuania halimionae TaxID=1926630 RepID=A0A6I4U4W3_9SPHN|nr:hypothetical protein [Alteriqipengyuania halimionae]
MTWRDRRAWLAPVIVFAALWSRALAAIVSVANPNDEARVGLELGIGFWTLPIAVSVLLALLFVRLARKRRLGMSWFMAFWLGASFGFATLVFGEALLPDLRF